MRNTCELHTQIWTVFSRPPYEFHYPGKQAYCTTERRASSRIPTRNLIRVSPDMSSTHLLLISLIYRMTLRLPYPADRSIIHALEKQLETSTDLNKTTANTARTCGHRSVVPTVSNWGLGSFRVKYPNHESMNTSQVGLVILR